MGDLSWRFDEREYNYVKEVLDSGFASGSSGNMNTRLEKAFADRFNLNFAITSSNGTTTLHTALWCMGVEPGDQVIVTPLTVISCMNAILYCGAIPVFADIDLETYLMDPSSVKRLISEKTKAIMAVHLYGQVCNMTEIMKIARENNLGVLEDCAQCYLGTHKGQIGGTIGDVGSWSFENSKHITTGDGGIIAFNDEELGDKMRRFSCQGFRNATAVDGKIRVSKDLFQNPEYKRHSQYGYNYRLPEVAAALGLAQLEKLDWFVNKRIKMLDMYLSVTKNCKWIKPQFTPDNEINSAYAFGATLERDDIDWQDFRKKHVENGGDGIYAAWALCYFEDSINDIRNMLKKNDLDKRFITEKGICPNAEIIQPKIMQFTTNQKSEEEMKVQAEALHKTINYFGN